MVHGLVCRDVLGGWMWTSKSIKGDYSGDYLLCWLDQLFVQVVYLLVSRLFVIGTWQTCAAKLDSQFVGIST